MLKPGYVAALLSYLVCHQESIEVGRERITTADMMDAGGHDVAAIWAVSKEYFEKYGKPIPKHALVAETININGDGWAFDRQEDELDKLIDYLYSVKEADFSTEEFNNLSGELLTGTRVRAPLIDAVGNGASPDELVDILNNGISQAAVGEIEVVDPLDDICSMFGTMPPDPVGGAEVLYFNQLCNGGLNRGEVAVILGPTGGYKTTMALDVCCAMANANEYSLYMTYEQTLKGGDLLARITSRLTGIDKDRVTGSGFDELSQEEKDTAFKAKEKSPFILLADRSKGCDKAADIGALIGRMIRKHKHPRLVVIDQLLQWLMPWPEYSAASDSRRVDLMRDSIDSLKKQVAEKYNTSVIVLHQVTAAKVGGSTAKKMNHNDSAGCKAICFWADFGIALGTEDKEHHVFYAVADKSRRGAGKSLLIRADGGRCHLMLCEDMEVSRDGSIVPKGGAAHRLDPSTPKPACVRAAPSPLSKGDL